MLRTNSGRSHEGTRVGRPATGKLRQANKQLEVHNSLNLWVGELKVKAQGLLLTPLQRR